MSDSYRVLLRDNTSREERWITVPLEWDDSSEYWWTEGNMGCDRNRHREFARAAGSEPDERVDCGETRYSAICAELPSGERIVLDDEVSDE